MSGAYSSLPPRSKWGAVAQEASATAFVCRFREKGTGRRIQILQSMLTVDEGLQARVAHTDALTERERLGGGGSKNQASSHLSFRSKAAARMAFISSSDGATPFSHLDIVACVTPAKAENSAWVSLKTFFRMCRSVFMGPYNIRIRIDFKSKIIRARIFLFAFGVARYPYEKN
ncbi:hypothetical protein [Daeguia caeni]|uniref:hypothetical protein n=1 Tax=Daeguia caeni TaxID=439612 RepID=UPI004041DD02